MTKTLVYSAKVCPKVKSSGGNYEVGKLQVGDGARVPTVGDRFSSKHSANHCCTLIKIRNSGKKPYTIEWDDGRKVHCDESWLLDLNFLEEKGEANAVCSDTPASLQESPVLNSELKQPELVTSSTQNSSLKTTPTLKQFSNTDSQVSQSTATSGTITLNRKNSTYTQLDFLVLEPAPQETVQDSNTQNHHSGLNPCDALPMAAPASSSLKILKDLSIEDYEQFLADSEWSATVGTIRNSYRPRKSERHTNETDSLLLPTPTTYCKGSTGCRPAGQTRLEQKLKPYLIKGDKLNPAVPGWMMGFPVGWVERVLMDGGVTISVQLPFTPEYVTTQINAESAMTSTPDQSAHYKQRSQSNESVTSPISPTSPLTRANAQAGTYIIDQHESLGIIKDNLGFGFVVKWLNYGKLSAPLGEVTYNWERDDQLIGRLAIAPQSLTDRFLEENHPQLCTRCLKVVERNYTCDKCSSMQCTQQIQEVHCPSCESLLLKLDEGCGVCGWTPENFLEESKEASCSAQKPKHRQRKGCVYKYLENKKLKNGSIVSYPRIIEDKRDPDNPQHWRWGFNWEEKVDGEWKGRSIGSIPVGVIAMIKSMQNQGVPLEEIIAFIKKSKIKNKT